MINDHCRPHGIDRIVLSEAEFQYRINGVHIKVEFFAGEENLTDLIERERWDMDYLEVQEMVAEELLRKHLVKGIHEDLYGSDILKAFKGIEAKLYTIEHGIRWEENRLQEITEMSVLRIENSSDY